MSTRHNLAFAASVVTSLGGAGYGSVEALQAVKNSAGAEALGQVVAYAPPTNTPPETSHVQKFAKDKQAELSGEVRGNVLRAATGGMWSIFGVAGALGARERKRKEQEDAAKGNSR